MLAGCLNKKIDPFRGRLCLLERAVIRTNGVDAITYFEVASGSKVPSASLTTEQ